MAFENVKEIILPLNEHRNCQQNNRSCSNVFRVCSVCKVQCMAGIEQRTGGESWEDVVVTSLRSRELAYYLKVDSDSLKM